MTLTAADLHMLTDRESLTAALNGRTRSEIKQTVLAIGPERVVVQVVEALNGGAAPRGDLPEQAVVQWFVTSPGAPPPTSFYFHIANGSFAALPGTADRAKATITLDVADFLLLMAGHLDVVKAFLSRRLRVTGDVMFARTIEGWFER